MNQASKVVPIEIVIAYLTLTMVFPHGVDLMMIS